MTVFQDFLDYLTAEIQAQSPPMQCSRAELAVEDTAVTLILRTRPVLTNACLSCAPFMYPITMMGNVRWALWHAAPYIENGSVALTTSELMRAVIVDAAESSKYGTRCDEDWLYVPQATDPSLLEDKDTYTSEEKWSGVLHTPDLPGLDHRPGVPSFGIAHVPDMPEMAVREEAWTHLSRLMLGWNYVREHFSESEQAVLGRSLRLSASRARTIAVFS